MYQRQSNCSRITGKFFWLLEIVCILLLAVGGGCTRSKGLKQNLDSLFCSVDQDGDGEIEQHEATKFLSFLSRKWDLSGESKESTGLRDGLNDLFFSHNFAFSYGGTTICAEEMMDHLQNMLTADRVVDWITHGLQLPQYAETFRSNAINGLDFPALIENESWTLAQELGVQSPLHRIKITHAIVRQVFGLGASPGPPEEAFCESAGCSTILLVWKPPSVKGYPPLHKYIVERWDDGASTWLSVIDNMKETSFLDKSSFSPSRNYSYRIQTWGGHGPSEWVLLDGCHASDTQSSLDQCYLESGFGNVLTSATEEFRHFYSDVSATDALLSGHSSHHDGQNVLKIAWGWIYSINGGLLLLGLLSRNSCFFHISVAVWMIFKAKVLGTIHLRLLKAQDSKYPVVRMLAYVIVRALASWNSLHTKVWLFATGMPKSPQPSLIEMNFSSGSDSYRDAIGFSSAECSFEEMLAAVCRLQNSSTVNDKKANIGKIVHCDDFDGGEIVSGADSECSRNSNSSKKTQSCMDKCLVPTGQYHDSPSFGLGDAQTDIVLPSDHPSLSAYSFVDGMGNPHCDTESEYGDKEIEGDISASSNRLGSSLARNRYMCHFEGCKARFDRWHSLSDWRMMFSKHYCRECQLVYCVKHTRISPHGSSGQCGLDSQCVCVDCFRGLSREAQKKLRQVNKLRVGPPVAGISLSSKKKNNVKQWASSNSCSQSADVDLLPTHKRSGCSQNRRNTENVKEVDKSDFRHCALEIHGPFPTRLNILESECSDGSVSDCSQPAYLSHQTSSISSGSTDGIGI